MLTGLNKYFVSEINTHKYSVKRLKQLSRPTHDVSSRKICFLCHLVRKSCDRFTRPCLFAALIHLLQILLLNFILFCCNILFSYLLLTLIFAHTHVCINECVCFQSRRHCRQTPTQPTPPPQEFLFTTFIQPQMTTNDFNCISYNNMLMSREQLAAAISSVVLCFRLVFVILSFLPSSSTQIVEHCGVAL